MTRYIAPVMIGLVGVTVLVWLGTWQLQRLQWKQGILLDIAETIAAPPRALPRSPDPQVHRYQPVELTGDISDASLHVLVSVKLRGAGWRIISRFDVSTPEGPRSVLLDRGYLETADKNSAKAATGVTVQGNLHWPDDRNSATPENNSDSDIWYARDIAQMATVLGTEPLLVILRRRTPADKMLTPLPLDPKGIPNDHLQYAVTWYSLAAVWLVMTGVWIRRLAPGTET
ncbi:MAG: SURF1 family protein [Pseudoprimorskyibacter sp.]|nr:SURF1 family protein [Pseudoprimorskyibacter sp.]